MTYPMGAGPYAGRFSGTPWVPGDPSSAPAAARAQFPRILAVRGTKIPSAARMVAVLGPPTHGQGWLVGRITVTCTAASVATIYVGTNSVDPENVVSGTPAGAMDEHDPSSPIAVPYGESMFVVWNGTGIVDGTVSVARIEYYEVD